MKTHCKLFACAIALASSSQAISADTSTKKVSQCRVSMMSSLFPEKGPDERVQIVQHLLDVNDLREQVVEGERPLDVNNLDEGDSSLQLIAMADSQVTEVNTLLASTRTYDATDLLHDESLEDDKYLYTATDIDNAPVLDAYVDEAVASAAEEASSDDIEAIPPEEQQARVTADKEYRFKLYNGLVKTQMEFLVAELFPEYTGYWGRYEGRHEWFGQYELVSKDRWELIDKLATTFNIKVEVSPNNVIEFIYTKG